jgi:uncharacterized protein YndB with AHSA1/START domain
MTTADVSEEARSLILSRLVSAPRSLVWRVMTDPTQLTHWWGPNGFSSTIHEYDFRVGGSWRMTMHGPDGTDYPNHSVFRKIVPQEFFSYQHGSSKNHPNGFLASITLSDEAGKTRVKLHMVIDSLEELERIRPYAVPGGEQTLARLDAHLQSLTSSSSTEVRS